MTQNLDAARSQPSGAVVRPRRVRVPVPAPVTPAPLGMGDPAGLPERIRLTSRYVERDGVPWFPVMGEYHSSRDRPGRWERELRKLKAGGINVVATYLLWIIHEEVRGNVRWDGHGDLRRFIETADRHTVPAEDVVRGVGVPVFGIPAVASARTGGSAGQLSASADADFSALATVEVPVADELFDDEQLILRLNWRGDALRRPRGRPAHRRPVPVGACA